MGFEIPKCQIAMLLGYGFKTVARAGIDTQVAIAYSPFINTSQIWGDTPHAQT
jgi:hypothetical protein